ncbi:hypothetical protein GW17_00011682 [Ensete ventricosum]|nr:hypothetical protein GW17_00011682 [Ensete ventricosum]
MASPRMPNPNAKCSAISSSASQDLMLEPLVSTSPTRKAIAVFVAGNFSSIRHKRVDSSVILKGLKSASTCG